MRAPHRQNQKFSVGQLAQLGNSGLLRNKFREKLLGLHNAPNNNAPSVG